MAEMKLLDCRGIMYSPCAFCSRSRKINVYRLSRRLHSQSRRVVDLAIDVAIGLFSIHSQCLWCHLFKSRCARNSSTQRIVFKVGKLGGDPTDEMLTLLCKHSNRVRVQLEPMLAGTFPPGLKERVETVLFAYVLRNGYRNCYQSSFHNECSLF